MHPQLVRSIAICKRMFEKGGAAVKQRPLIGTYRYSIYGCPPLLKHVLRRRWANQPLNTFVEALEAFRTAMSCRFIQWLNQNGDVFIAYKATLGLIWA